jgi:integrase
VIALPQILKAILEQQWQEHLASYSDCPFVFNREGHQIKNFRNTWKRVCHATGLAGKIPHDFRRTAVRNLVRAGVPERVAMMITGHKTRSVFDRYNIVSDGDLQEAARKLDRLGTPPEPAVAQSQEAPFTRLQGEIRHLHS